MTTVVICAGGPLEELIDFRQWKKEDTIFIGADKGALHLLRDGIIPDEAVGDFDSISIEEYDEIKEKVKRVDKFQAEKNETDTEIAMERAIAYKPKEIVLVGVTGGRLDHMLSALHLLYRYQKEYRHISFRILNRTNQLSILFPGKHMIKKEQQFRYISFFAFKEEIHSLTLQNFKYETFEEQVENGMTKFTSNELLQKEGTISFQAGICLMVRSSDA